MTTSPAAMPAVRRCRAQRGQAVRSLRRRDPRQRCLWRRSTLRGGRERRHHRGKWRGDRKRHGCADQPAEHLCGRHIVHGGRRKEYRYEYGRQGEESDRCRCDAACEPCRRRTGDANGERRHGYGRYIREQAVRRLGRTHRREGRSDRRPHEEQGRSHECRAR